MSFKLDKSPARHGGKWSGNLKKFWAGMLKRRPDANMLKKPRFLNITVLRAGDMSTFYDLIDT
jgi:hypothetical protein